MNGRSYKLGPIEPTCRANLAIISIKDMFVCINHKDWQSLKPEMCGPMSKQKMFSKITYSSN